MTWLNCPCRHVFVRSKRVLIALLLLAFLPSCSGFGDGTDASETATPVRGVLSTVAPNAATAQPLRSSAASEVAEATAVPTATAIVTPGAVGAAAAPTTSPAVSTGGFSHLRFAPAADGTAQNEYPAGTEVVFALWDYDGLSEVDRIRRIWFRDDQIWITREESWNWDEYGSAGTVRDISIFDNEGDGLQPATYRLQLYLNDELQVEGTFVVLAE